MIDDLQFDVWTPLSFKKALGQTRYEAPTWVGHHQRRLQAYTILQAYLDNAAREFLQQPDVRERDQHREYGDSALVRDAILSAVLGDEQTITVQGADEYSPDEEPEEGGEGQDEQARMAWELQEWLRAWADDERLTMKMNEAESDAVGLGDGVYALGWNSNKGRPRLRVFDPGFYFPVEDDGNEDEFPTTIHIAWEFHDPSDLTKKQIRRITWRLVQLEEERRYPWNDDPSNVTCLLSDAVWNVELGSKQTVDDLDESRAQWMEDEDGEIRDRDLMIDFIPVVHIPNNGPVKEHFGQSSLLRILQVLDDLANADTDLQAASATTGTPPVTISGAQVGDSGPTYRPGELISVGDGGRMDVLDTSRSLDALLKYVEALLDRMSINARLPASVLGRVSGADVPSGLALLLSFGPLRSMVSRMRLVRDEKYTLLLKFAWRLSVAGQAEGVPQRYFKPAVEFGNYMPEDKAAAVTQVKELLNTRPPAISLETAVRILQQAGFPIEDAVTEVTKIQSTDFDGAVRLLDALGDETAVFEYLGREQPEVSARPEAPPTITPPV